MVLVYYVKNIIMVILAALSVGYSSRNTRNRAATRFIVCFCPVLKMERSTNAKKKKGEPPLIPRAGVNQTTFRILLTGPGDVIPVMARHMKKCFFEKHKVTNLKIHHAVSLTEEIALKLSSTGLHAAVLCTDPSNAMTKSHVQETLRYLHFDIISTSMFILNLVHPLPVIHPTVADTVKKLSITYNIHVIHIHYEDEESVKFGLDRVCTVALRGAKFIYGNEPLFFNSIDFSELKALST